MAQPGLDPARHLPAVAQRIYGPEYGPNFNIGGPSINGTHLVTVLNSSENYANTSFIANNTADRMFKRDIRYPHENGIELTRRTLTNQTHTTKTWPSLKKAAFIGGVTLLGATGGFLAAPVLGLSALASTGIGSSLGLSSAGAALYKQVIGSEEIETKAYENTNAIRHDDSIAIDIPADLPPGRNYHIRTYSYKDKTDQTPVEKWSPLHDIEVDYVNGSPVVRNVGFQKVNGGNGTIELKLTYVEVVKTLHGLKFDIRDNFEKLTKAKQDLIKAERDHARVPNHRKIAELRAEIDEGLDKHYELTKKFDTMLQQVATPLLMHLKKVIHDPVLIGKYKEELKSLREDIVNICSTRAPSVTTTEIYDLNEYGALLKDDYAKMIRFYQEEGQTVARDDKYKAFLPLIRKVESETQVHPGNINLDRHLAVHLQTDTDLILNREFRGQTLAQLQYDINHPNGAALPPADQVDFTPFQRTYLDGSGYTYAPVLYAFREDLLQCHYDQNKGRMVPNRTPDGRRIPNIDAPLTELKDKYYYEYIPDELKTILDEFYTAFKEYREMVKEERLAQAERDGRIPWYVKLGARLGFDTKGKTQKRSDALEMMIQMFGDPKAQVNGGRPRRRAGPAQNGGVPAANGNMQIIMAILNAD